MEAMEAMDHSLSKIGDVPHLEILRRILNPHLKHHFIINYNHNPHLILIKPHEITIESPLTEGFNAFTSSHPWLPGRRRHTQRLPRWKFQEIHLYFTAVPWPVEDSGSVDRARGPHVVLIWGWDVDQNQKSGKNVLRGFFLHFGSFLLGPMSHNV